LSTVGGTMGSPSDSSCAMKYSLISSKLPRQDDVARGGLVADRHRCRRLEQGIEHAVESDLADVFCSTSLLCSPGWPGTGATAMFG